MDIMRAPERTYDFENDRIVCWFSCGATSAVACWLMREYPNAEFCYCDTGGEHESNKKFLHDVEEWIGRDIKILRSDKYTDIWDVFEKTGWLVGPSGARCTLELKKSVRQQYEEYDDIQVFGFDSGEITRVEKFIKNNQECKLYAPLIEKGISKQMALEMLKKQGIELPFMYQPQKSGTPYSHNNCVGCVKGGQGYWNKIRVDFPEVFEKMNQTERKIKAAVNKTYMKHDKLIDYIKYRDRDHWLHEWYQKNYDKIQQKKDKGLSIRVPVYLDELDPNAGNFEKEGAFECDLLCQAAVNEFIDEEDDCEV